MRFSYFVERLGEISRHPRVQEEKELWSKEGIRLLAVIFALCVLYIGATIYASKIGQ